jgi:uncharacterized protein (DUF2225 family)
MMHTVKCVMCGRTVQTKAAFRSGAVRKAKRLGWHQLGISIAPVIVCPGCYLIHFKTYERPRR